EYPAWRPKPASWTKLFGTFLVALDPFKLLVAAAGILVTALGWWLISVIFYNAWTVPTESYYEDRAKKDSSLKTEDDRAASAKAEYLKAVETWALMHELAGPTDRSNPDFARYYQLRHPDPAVRNPRLAEGYGGKYRTMPWAENRGPNPFLMTKTVIGGGPPPRTQGGGPVCHHPHNPSTKDARAHY